jgi:chemotaxis protein histidine kinase CheA
MTSPQPTGVIDLFVLQASDYIEQLDGALNSAGVAGPDGEALARAARMLRGSATMTKVLGVAEVAAGLERVGRAMREGSLLWEPGLRAALTAAVDDLKILVRGAREWGHPEEQRAQARASELGRYAPQMARNTPSAATGGNAYLANEAAEIAVGLDQLLAHPSDALLLGGVLARVRGLRGVAATRDLPPMAEVVDAIERAAKPLELSATPSPSAVQLALFGAAGTLLRRVAIELRSLGRPDPSSPEVLKFSAAAAALDAVTTADDRIVPIADLFYPDGGPHVVAAAPNPPTTPAQRFRLEGVSQAEHLLRLVSEAQAARDPAARDRLSRELRAALRALQAAAQSFGEASVARYLDSVTNAVAQLDAPTLATLRNVASLLADPARSGSFGEELSRLTAQGGQAAATGQVLSDLSAPSGQSAPSATSAPATQARPAAPPPRVPANGVRARTPTGRDLAALLDAGISGLGQQLTQRPLSQPVAIIDEELIPIETLLYRGRAALDRARELRNQVRGAGRTPSGDELAELNELLEMATTD